MLPTTHYLYLALGLFTVGLAGTLLRRSLLSALLGVQLMFVAAALLATAYGREHQALDGSLLATVVMLAGLLELAIAVAVVGRMHGEQPEGEAPATDWAELGGEDRDD